MWASAARDLGAFASSFRAWCDQVPKKEARRHCGVFTVSKRSRDQRLIIDACIQNTPFEAPDPVALPTGQSFARWTQMNRSSLVVSTYRWRSTPWGCWRPLKRCSRLTASKSGRWTLPMSSARTLRTKDMVSCSSCFFDRVPLGARTHGGDCCGHFNSESIH